MPEKKLTYSPDTVPAPDTVPEKKLTYSVERLGVSGSPTHEHVDLRQHLLHDVLGRAHS